MDNDKTLISDSTFSLIWHNSNENTADIIYSSSLGKGKRVYNEKSFLVEEPTGKGKNLDSRLNVKNTNGKCKFQLGKCQYKVITQYGTEEEYEVFTTFDKGIWKIKHQDGTIEKIFYDEFGLPLINLKYRTDLENYNDYVTLTKRIDKI